MIYFTSQKNYMKHAAIASDTMSRPSTPNGIFYDSTKTITHNLGYLPLVRAWYDPNDDGTIAPARGMDESSGLAGLEFPWWFWVSEITENEVTFKAQSFSSESGNFPFLYRIYYDRPN